MIKQSERMNEKKNETNESNGFQSYRKRSAWMTAKEQQSRLYAAII